MEASWKVRSSPCLLFVRDWDVSKTLNEYSGVEQYLKSSRETESSETLRANMYFFLSLNKGNRSNRPGWAGLGSASCVFSLWAQANGVTTIRDTFSSGKAVEEGEQGRVLPLKPLFRTHTMTFLPTYYWSKQVTCPGPKSMGKNEYSSNWKV